MCIPAAEPVVLKLFRAENGALKINWTATVENPDPQTALLFRAALVYALVSALVYALVYALVSAFVSALNVV